MAHLSLVLFGGFRASLGGRPIGLPLKKAQALLAFLALPAGKSHSRERLASLLWGDSPDDQARNSLRQTLFAIRAALARSRHLVADGRTVRLEPGGVDVDVETFERLVARGSEESLGKAVALYKGDVLDGVEVGVPSFDEWMEATRERLRRAATGAMSRLLERQVKAGSIEGAIATAGRLLRLDPLQEAIHRALIRLYARQGRRTAAIRQYQICVDLLRRELQAEPEPETVEVYQALFGERAARSPSPGAARGERPTTRTPFIGRGAELTGLRQRLREAARRGGGVVALLGEAGVGKTRLTEELIAGTDMTDTLVLRGRSYESARVLPFALWVDAFEKEAQARMPELRNLGHGWARDLEPLFPDVRQSHGRPARAGDRLRLFEAVTQFVGWLAAARTLVVVLEDLQWADDTSLRLLALLGRRLAAWPVLVIVTARPEEIDQTRLSATLAELDREQRLTRLTLGPLSPADTEALARTLAPAELPAPVLSAVVERARSMSEGNPFVLTEMMRVTPRRSDGGAASAPALPDTVRDMILNRVRRLSARDQRLLFLAAVIGRDFDLPLLEVAAGLGDLDAAEAVDHLARVGMFREIGERLDVAHDRIREAVASDLRPPRRRALHAAIARALETIREDGPGHDSADLARHYRGAGMWDKAVKYLRMAGGQAAARGAYREAVGFLEQALGAVSRLPDGPPKLAESVDVRIDLRDWVMPLGELTRLGTYLQEAEAAARRLADDRRTALAIGHLAHFYVLIGQPERALHAARETAAFADCLHDLSLHVLSNFYLGEAHHSLGDYRASVEFLRRNLTLVSGEAVFERYAGPGLVPLQSRFWLAFSLAELGRFEEATAIALEAHGAAQRVQHPYSFAFAEYAVGRLQVEQRLVEPALAALERARALVESREIVLMSPAVDGWLGYARAISGRAGDGISLLRQAGKAASAMGRSGRGLLNAFLAEALLRDGLVAEALPAATEALDLTCRQGERGHEAVALRVLGEVHAALRDTRLAEARCRESLVLAQSLAMRPAVARCHLALGHLYRKVGRVTDGNGELARAAGLFAEMGLAAWVDEVRAAQEGAPATAD